MKTYEISLMRKGSGVQRSQDTVTVQAKSHEDARRIAEVQYPDYRIVSITEA